MSPKTTPPTSPIPDWQNYHITYEWEDDEFPLKVQFAQSSLKRPTFFQSRLINTVSDTTIFTTHPLHYKTAMYKYLDRAIFEAIGCFIASLAAAKVTDQ